MTAAYSILRLPATCRASRVRATLLLLILAAAAPGVAADVRIVGDAIPQALASAGDAERGRKLALDRNRGACLLCHALPEPSARFMGTMGPALTGVGNRLTAAQLRLRVVDSTRVNPAATMPPYYRLEGLNQVAAAYRGRTIFTGQEVEDVVAYLETLK